jgi:protein-disulfide isomerase/uncharacterized membrane protein
VTQETSTLKKIGFFVQTVASLLGVVISLYLLVQHTRLKMGIQGSASFCSLGAHLNCDVVNSSPYAEMAGIPLAAVGAAFYFLLLMLSVARRSTEQGFLRTQRVILVLTALGFVADVPLFYIQAALLNNFCVMCLSTYLMTVLIGVGVLLRTAGGRKIFSAREDGGETPSGAWTIGPSAAFIVFALAVAIVPKAIEQNSGRPPTEAGTDEDFFVKFKTMPARPIEIRSVDATFGNANAKVKIVEFSDFECPFCRKGALTIHTAMAELKDRAFFVFKNYPLDISCNSNLTRPMHANSCELARLGYCATQKNRFWEFHDRVFLSWDEEESKPGRVIAAVNKGDFNGLFTSKEVQDCLNNPDSLQKIKEDIALGDRLDVHGTPTVFVNGKRMTIGLSVENLKRLVEIEESNIP